MSKSSAMKNKISPGSSSGLTMSNFKSSQNYLWNTNAVLGKGATGAVYFGHNKSSGETVAVKCFNHLSHMRPYEVQKREFEVLKKVNHENIVRLLAIEEESDTKQKVLVMELCTGGSLFNILDDPINSSGLEEKEFIYVTKHLAAGMKHLRDMNIIHRDLKPGNIMKFVAEDGSSIYKLTDFGAARELDDDQQFMSLYGTEEYLHPDMYERAVLRKPVGKSFKANVDLWSIGVTLYHIATGTLPFRPYGGRKNKETMYKITTEKSSGIISGSQTSENGEIKWSRNLPETCQLSPSLQPLVTDLLAGLLECDAHRMWSFEQFFSSVTHILEHKVLFVFYAGTLAIYPIYCHSSERISDLKNKFQSMFNIVHDDQILIYCNEEFNINHSNSFAGYRGTNFYRNPSSILHSVKRVSDILFLPDDFVLSDLVTSENHPLFLINGQMNSKIRPAFGPIKANQFPDLSTNTSTDIDAQQGKYCSSLAYSVLRHIDKFIHNHKLACHVPSHMLKLIEKNIKLLDEKQKTSTFNMKMLREQVEHLYDINTNLNSLIKMVTEHGKDWIKPHVYSFPNCELLRTQYEKLHQTFKSLNTSTIMDDKVDQLRELWLQNRDSDSSKNLLIAQAKAKMFSVKIRECWLLLHKDKQIKTLNYHEEKLHQLEKVKLDSFCKKLNELVMKEINPCLSIADKLEEWYQGAQVAHVKPQLIMTELDNMHPAIAELESGIKSAKEEQTKIWNNLFKDLSELFQQNLSPQSNFMFGDKQEHSQDTEEPTNDDNREYPVNGSLSKFLRELNSLREDSRHLRQVFREHEAAISRMMLSAKTALLLLCALVLTLFAQGGLTFRSSYDDPTSYGAHHNQNHRSRSSYSSTGRHHSKELQNDGDDLQQRQTPTRDFDRHSSERTSRYEWSRQYYHTSSSTTTTTSTRAPDYRSYFENRARDRPTDRDRESSSSSSSSVQRTVSVSRGISNSDNRQMPGSYKWYNHTWTDNKNRGYDPDLDGPTQPPTEAEHTYDEEEWDGTDFYRPPEDDRHPMGPNLPGRCDDYQACYPATGNLLIGRENRLDASSTCGLKKQVRYCVVSDLKERKKCFYCDSRPELKGNSRYHGIENIVSRIGKAKRKQFWWQAENGEENVSIQFDLEAEFHFTHLIMTFKTFRPAAMVIERSHDLGKTWQTYQYFAYDCLNAFPGIPTGSRYRITDVVCDSLYSGIEPSSEGEVIFRVLPPNIRIEDPYAKEVQDMLKITNLRINFTKLHTLGDDLLESAGRDRDSIKEKYYYSMYDMVVRGSCSCYGHASRCIPDHDETIPDMVYGKCDCTHHTKGRNCEFCEDLYNDLQWQPAIGRNTNACKKCNCNNHASRCHFDNAVYHSSNNKSGGVCDDCQHNTMGHNCERCKPFYYRDPLKSLDDPYVCQACDCDPRGSEDEGLCDAYTDAETQYESGACHCKRNVEGRRCDHCKASFWNLNDLNPDGCEPCLCNQLGTVDNLGCNVNSGECVCKRNVVGRDCNQCAPNYWGLSEDEEGCKACDCDPGGAYSGACDQATGQCQCRPHASGRRCDQPEEGYYVPYLDHLTYEAEKNRIRGSGDVVQRSPYNDRQPSWTGTGFVQLYPRSSIEFLVDNVPESKLYDLVVRYEPTVNGQFEGEIIVQRPGGLSSFSPCYNHSQADRQSIRLSSMARYAVAEKVCLEKNIPYTVEVRLLDPEQISNADGSAPSIFIDSLVALPRYEDIPFFGGSLENDHRRREFEHMRCHQMFYSLIRQPEVDEYCKKSLTSMGFYVFDGAFACQCDETGSSSRECKQLGGQCLCKKNVAERVCDRCHVGYYGFGPDGCQPCDCHGQGSLDGFCDVQTGQCKCQEGTYGRACDECKPGFWNYPSCQRCDCHGFSEMCDSKTGTCQNCRDNTAGRSCDQCADGYFGDPLGLLTGGVPVPCRQCPCPGVEGSGMTHASTCQLDARTQNVICNCKPGYSGERCDRCDENYFGDPTVVDGECTQCNCSSNIDISAGGNCDRKTGQCLKCLYNTAGEHCEVCNNGFYGNALNQSCTECVCHNLGTDQRSAFCDVASGQCSCLPNVEGKSCDRCAENHYDLQSGKGCSACDCDPQGSYSMKCNELDGQCHCKPSFGGRKCNECLPNHWGDPRVQCQQCDCNLSGSSSSQCDKNTGHCVCVEGISGQRCDRCARGFTGTAPHCKPCGECFDNWDLIIGKLKNETLGLLDKARLIKHTGTPGAYTKQFTLIEDSLKEVNEILAGQDINKMNLEQVENMISDAKKNLETLQDLLNNHEKQLDDTRLNIVTINDKLEVLTQESKKLRLEAERLKEEATLLQEANDEGAYNITKDAQRRSRASKSRISEKTNILLDSEKKRMNTENLILKASGKHNLTYQENDASLRVVQMEIAKMEAGVPDINERVCDGRSTIDECNNLCGGAGCGHCGGVSCTNGATTKATNALDMSKSAESKLLKKQAEAKDELRRITEAREKAEEALREAKAAFDRIMAARNVSESTASRIREQYERMSKFLEGDMARPAEIRTLSEECTGLNIKLDENKIQELSRLINETIEGLTDIDKILMETREALKIADDLKLKAEYAKTNAEAALQEANSVRSALEEARAAQEKAQQSISDANRDINDIEKDLKEIDEETTTVQKKSEDSIEKIGSLNGRLDELKRKYANNDFSIQRADKEAAEAKLKAEEANRGADELEKQYQKAFEKLNQKSQVSDTLKKRANDMKDKAKQLFRNISNKVQKINDFESLIVQNENKLNDLQKQIDDLNNNMKNHLEHIEAKAKHYRECQA